jgi:hypothetical protein
MVYTPVYEEKCNHKKKCFIEHPRPWSMGMDNKKEYEVEPTLTLWTGMGQGCG